MAKGVVKLQKGITFDEVKEAINLKLQLGQVPNIIGESGIGKTELVKEVAEDMGYKYYSITCSLLQEGEMAMPAVIEKKLRYILHPILTKIAKNAEEGKDSILFFDEVNRALPSVMSELMNVIWEKEVMGIKLPKDKLHVVCAMNPDSAMGGYEDTDYTVNKADDAFMTRIINLRMRPDFKGWKEGYAKRKCKMRLGNLEEVEVDMIHPSVIRFLESRPEYFLGDRMMDEFSDAIGLPNPRTWRKLSQSIYGVEILEMSGKLTKDMGDIILAEEFATSLGETVGLEALMEYKTTYDFITTSDLLSQKVAFCTEDNIIGLSGKELTVDIVRFEDKDFEQRVKAMSGFRSSANFTSLVKTLAEETLREGYSEKKIEEIWYKLLAVYFLLDVDLQHKLSESILSVNSEENKDNKVMEKFLNVLDNNEYYVDVVVMSMQVAD